MSLNFNQVTIAGNLVRDPEIKFLAGDKAVAKFDMAINRRWKDSSGETKEETTFVSCEAWGRTAELVGQFLTKGRGALVTGRLKQDLWEIDGQKRSKLRVVADAVHFTDAKGVGGEANNEGTRPAPAAQPSAESIGGGSAYSDSEPPFARSEHDFGA